MYARRLGRGPVALLVATTYSLAVAGYAVAEADKCKTAIIKASSGFAHAQSTALQKCEASVVMGKLPQSTDCVTTAAAAISKASDKLTAAIDKACGGDDKVCGGDLTGEDGGAAIGFPATCPNFENGSCTNAIGGTNCTGIATCLLCIDEAAVDQAIGLSYDELVTKDPKAKTDKPLIKCQSAIGKLAAGFFAAKSKLLSKCWDAVIKGKVIGTCPDGATAAKIAAAADKVSAGILNACAGKDKALGGSGVNTDYTPNDIGFADSCYDVTPPSKTVSCAGSVGDLQGLIDCVTCVNEFKADCGARGAAAPLAAYPAECNLPPSNDCPTGLEIQGTPGDAKVLDTGWTGIAHNQLVIQDSKLSFGLSACASATRPCGQCTVTGPIRNLKAGHGDIDSQRCSNDTSIKCTSNTPCGTGTCQFFFGAPLPLSAGGVSTCVTNQIDGSITGTANVESGDFSSSIKLKSSVFLVDNVAQPCPLCLGDATVNDGVAGGTCNGGAKPGAACDGNGESTLFGTTSFDCPSAIATRAAILSIDLTGASATVTRTLDASSPGCTGAPGKKCFCPAGAGGTGSPTQPNACIDDTFTTDIDESMCASAGAPNEGECLGGPVDRNCKRQTFIGCTSNADCASDDECVVLSRPCYLDNGIVGHSISAVGMADPPDANHESDPTFAALFCIPLTGKAAIDTAAGLPGMGRIELPLHAKEIP